jgi:hypothetical protein
MFPGTDLIKEDSTDARKVRMRCHFRGLKGKMYAAQTDNFGIEGRSKVILSNIGEVRSLLKIQRH